MNNIYLIEISYKSASVSVFLLTKNKDCNDKNFGNNKVEIYLRKENCLKTNKLALLFP